MKILWIKLRSNGEIENEVADQNVPSVGDGVFLAEIGYEVKGIVNTPHLECPVHVFVTETL